MEGGTELKTITVQAVDTLSLFKSRAHPALSHSTQVPPQGCVLSPLLRVLLTHDCTPSHTSKLFIRLHNCGGSHQPIIRNESRYRASVSGQDPGCITQDLSLSTNISSLARKPHRHFYFLKLRKAKDPPVAPSKASWPAASRRGTAPAPHSAIGPSSISWEQQKRSLVQHLQGSWSYSSVTPLPQPAALRRGECRVSWPGPADRETASSTGPSWRSTPSPHCPPFPLLSCWLSPSIPFNTLQESKCVCTTCKYDYLHLKYLLFKKIYVVIVFIVCTSWLAVKVIPILWMSCTYIVDWE